jgi:hypothetical protein
VSVALSNPGCGGGGGGVGLITWAQRPEVTSQSKSKLKVCNRGSKFSVTLEIYLFD